MRIAKIMQTLSKELNKQKINHRIRIKNDNSKIISEKSDLYNTEVIILMDLKKYNVEKNEDNIE
tara:strand:+ start:95 stop:286 length:192 start_codon:yes stop_codon:yes gene_type:complete